MKSSCNMTMYTTLRQMMILLTVQLAVTCKHEFLLKNILILTEKRQYVLVLNDGVSCGPYEILIQLQNSWK